MRKSKNTVKEKETKKEWWSKKDVFFQIKVEVRIRIA